MSRGIMALAEYKQKRSFNRTPEPTGGRPSTARLAFVVQKHQASHLHYDFRLEMRGVLKSWAVPKGPSMKASEKRLAMLVEDHPFDYKDFEGIIPDGNYGAGTVIIWDEGWYEPSANIKGKKAQEHELLKQFYSGSLKITLHGKKLKGNFILTKNVARGETSWLLSKIKDSHALTTDISKKDKSVISDKTIEEMAASEDAQQWQSNRKKSKNSPSPKKTSAAKGTKSVMPINIRPMLATLSEGLVNDDRYLYEVKWDGYRIMSYVKTGKARLNSRGGKDYTQKYPPVVKALKELDHDVILDGEMVVFDKEGHPSFNAVQLYNGHNTPINYYVFDILHLDGYDLKELALTERKQILQELIGDNEVIKFSDSFDDGGGLYKLMQQKGWEGVVAKKKDSLYLENDRSNNWLKFPVKRMDEFIIGGWAESDKARSFRSILFGAYDKGKLKWVGRSGGGFKEKEMPGILKKLQALEIKESPFTNPVLDTKGAKIHWVKPKLVANFEYAEMTETGRIRKPATWLGFREDKDPKDVIVPVVKKISDATAETINDAPAIQPATGKNKSAPGKKKYLNAGSGWQKVDEEQNDAEWTDFKMENCTIPVHNLERELWEGVPKGKLLIYYSQIADIILPYIKDRPQSLNLKLTHAGGPRTFIKDMENRQPDCAAVFSDKRRIKKAGKRNQIDYLVCNNRETLVYLTDLGCVDVNTWASRTDHIEEPDYLWLDLDPTIPEELKGKQLTGAEEKGFAKAVEAALACKKILDKHKLTAFIKTSGKTGLHIYVPCRGFNFTEARSIAYKLADEAHALVSTITTRNESINQRGDKVYIDAGQNDYADTLAAPYSIRPYHEPLVSTPLEWKEVKKGLDRYAFSLDTIQKRVETKGDIWKKLTDKKILAANNRALKKL